MLEGFRKNKNSLVVKLLLFLLIASFALWGIGDMLAPATQGGSVATVSGEEIPAQEVYTDYQREMARMRQLTGQQGVEEALAQAIGASVLDRAINRTLLKVAANEMDVAISDDVVSRSIRNNEMFQDNGSFSRARFDQIMFSNQLTEAQFIEIVREDLEREQVISVLVGGATMPEYAAKELYNHRQEKRSADTVLIQTDQITDTPAPSDDDVRAYYNANIDNYMAPEYRKVTMLHITPDEVAKTIDIPVEDIEDAFAARQGDFIKPAHRVVEQMVFGTEEEAKAAVTLINSGQDFAAVAKEKLDIDPDGLLLGDVRKDDLPDELQEPVFGLSLNAVSEPIQSLLGWHLVRVTQIVDEVNPSFEDVRDQLRTELALEQTSEELFSISNDIEDALGGGATIEEAARTSGFNLEVIEAVDQNGLDKAGNVVAKLATQQTIIADIFEIDVTSEPQMKDDNNSGYYMLRLESVTETTPRPFDTVADAVRATVMAENRLNAAKTKADELLGKLEGGQSLSDVATEAGFAVVEQTGFTRFDAPLPSEITSGLFDIKVGETTSGPAQGGYMIALLKDVQSLETAGDANAINALRREMANGISGDLQGQFVNALRTSHSVSIDQGVLNQILTQANQ